MQSVWFLLSCFSLPQTDIKALKHLKRPFTKSMAEPVHFHRFRGSEEVKGQLFVINSPGGMLRNAAPFMCVTRRKRFIGVQRKKLRGQESSGAVYRLLNNTCLSITLTCFMSGAQKHEFHSRISPSPPDIQRTQRH